MIRQMDLLQVVDRAAALNRQGMTKEATAVLEALSVSKPREVTPLLVKVICHEAWTYLIAYQIRRFVLSMLDQTV